MRNIFNYKDVRQEGRVRPRGEEAVQLDTGTGEMASLPWQWEGEEGSMRRRRKSLQVLDETSTLYSTCTRDDVQARLHMPRRFEERSSESRPRGQ